MITDGRAVATNKCQFDSWMWWHNTHRGACRVWHEAFIAFTDVLVRTSNFYAVCGGCIATMSAVVANMLSGGRRRGTRWRCYRHNHDANGVNRGFGKANQRTCGKNWGASVRNVVGANYIAIDNVSAHSNLQCSVNVLLGDVVVTNNAVKARFRVIHGQLTCRDVDRAVDYDYTGIRTQRTVVVV